MLFIKARNSVYTSVHGVSTYTDVFVGTYSPRVQPAHLYICGPLQAWADDEIYIMLTLAAKGMQKV